ncbi:hypothetical protein M8818_003254 [Zalaria obscura]|uniref:Uncharacterized protein n=1 Tax=Zalaria obscura TaxID=2024903 RepID=A0ACC3SFF1_9PEZI
MAAQNGSTTVQENSASQTVEETLSLAAEQMIIQLCDRLDESKDTIANLQRQVAWLQHQGVLQRAEVNRLAYERIACARHLHVKLMLQQHELKDTKSRNKTFRGVARKARDHLATLKAWLGRAKSRFNFPECADLIGENDRLLDDLQWVTRKGDAGPVAREIVDVLREDLDELGLADEEAVPEHLNPS